MNYKQKRYTIKRIEKYNIDLEEKKKLIIRDAMGIGFNILALFSSLFLASINNFSESAFIGIPSSMLFIMNTYSLINNTSIKNNLLFKIEDLQSSLEMEEIIEDEHTLSRRK